MAPQVRSPKLDTRTARAKLPVGKAPHWIGVGRGAAIGYRKGVGGGTWLARMRDAETGRQYQTFLGAADDVRDADGLTVLSFPQAQERARSFFDRKAREIAGHFVPVAGPYRVADCLKAYFDARERRGSKGVKADRYAADARIVPTLGDVELSRLTALRIKTWQSDLAVAPKRVRTKTFAKKQATRPMDRKDPDAVRARQSTANRVLTILKAALNHAFHEGRVANDDAWRKVKPFREADSAIARYILPTDAARLVDACRSDFAKLVRGALLTGCRYGELTRMRAGDFNADAGTVTVRQSKAGKSRHVALNDEGIELFSTLARGLAPKDLLFRRDDGREWRASEQQRPLEEASRKAGIEPAATFHILRHTYASSLAMRGVPLNVIATQLGHADTRMTERHYAHLAPSYVAETVRKALPSFRSIEAT